MDATIQQRPSETEMPILMLRQSVSIIIPIVLEFSRSDPSALVSGLARDKIDAIPTIAVEQEHVDEELACSVCLVEFIVSEPVRNLACKHLFHGQCIITWLEQHDNCPLCRRPI